MTLVELDRALRQLRLSGMASVLETRLRQAQTERLARSTSCPPWSTMNCSAGKTGCWNDARSRRAFATRTGRSTASTLISTRR